MNPETAFWISFSVAVVSTPVALFSWYARWRVKKDEEAKRKQDQIQKEENE